MSLVLAADYRVPDFDHWWAALAGDLPGCPASARITSWSIVRSPTPAASS